MILEDEQICGLELRAPGVTRNWRGAPWILQNDEMSGSIDESIPVMDVDPNIEYP